ncbi:MAG: sigma-70 family RNA polymerase sigma factor [Planctomycetota bacterium]
MTKRPTNSHRRFLDLYSKVQPRLYSFIMMLVQSNHDADEIFQETSALLWDKFDQYQEGTNFGAWAVSIAKYQVFDYLRKNKKYKRRLSPEMLQGIADIAEAESGGINERIQVLRGCLYKLDRMNRSLLSLRYQQNVSVEQIAQRKGVSTGVIYRKLTKIFGVLRKCINLSMVQAS